MIKAQGSSADGGPLAASVSALLEEARWLLDDEQLRGARLDTKLVLLAGLAGLMLAIVAPMGASGFQGTPGTLFDLLYAATVLLLAGSALLALSIAAGTRVVRSGGEVGTPPWRQTGAGNEVLDKLAGEFTAEPPVRVEQRMIATVVEGIKDQRVLNGRRWGVLKLAAFSLVAALLALMGQGITLLFAW